MDLQMSTCLVESKSDYTQQLIDKIFDKCSGKFQLRGDVVKEFFQDIAIFLSQFLSDRRRSRDQYNQSEKRISNLNQEIKLLKKSFEQKIQLEKIQNKNQNGQFFKKIKKVFESKCQKIQAQVTQKYNKIEGQLEKNQRAIKESQQKIKKQLNRIDTQKLNKNKIEELVKTYIEGTNKKIDEIKSNSSKIIQILGQRLEKVEKTLDKMDLKAQERAGQLSLRMEQVYKTVWTLDKWVDHNCKRFDKLTIVDNKIIAKDWAIVFGKNKLQGKYDFTTKFIKISESVSLGLADSLNKNGKNNNFIMYYSDGDCDVAGDLKVNQGNKFKTGQQVRVMIDMNLGCIEWKVRDQTRHKITTPKLRDSNIDWVPFIKLNSGDEIQINE